MSSSIRKFDPIVRKSKSIVESHGTDVGSTGDEMKELPALYLSKSRRRQNELYEDEFRISMATGEVYESLNLDADSCFLQVEMEYGPFWCWHAIRQRDWFICFELGFRQPGEN